MYYTFIYTPIYHIIIHNTISIKSILFLLHLNSTFLFSALLQQNQIHSIFISTQLMEDRKEKNAPWLSVPQFGDWDQKGQVPDYSMDFSKIREMRKQNKRDVSRASLGNEEELIAKNAQTVSHTGGHQHHYQQDHSPTARRSIFSYFNCCVKA